MAGMVVKNNMSALNTLNMLNTNHSQLSKSLAKVSSGMRINGAADDASGYAISERMRVQIRGLEQDNRNTQNGNSLLKVAEGAVSSTVDILKTLKEKVINAANDTNTDEDRATIQKELDQSIDQINDNANVTYNGKYLVDGTKNSQGSATYTALTNKSLATDTQTGTSLTDLKNRNGENLGILSSDTITVSYVQNGKTYTSSFTVGTTCLHDIFVSAEAADASTQTFADKTNSSVSKASGFSSPASVIADRTRLYNAWQAAEADVVTKTNAVTSAQNTVNSAQSAVTTAQNAVNSLTAKQGTVTSSLNTLGGKVTVLPNNNTVVGNDGPLSLWGQYVISGYNTWKGSSSSPDPSTITSSGTTAQQSFYSVATGNAVATSGYTTALSDIKTAFDNYKTAYNDYNVNATYTALTGSNPGSTGTGDTALQYASDDLTAAQTDLANAQSALTTAQNDLAAAKSAATTARNTYYAQFGPYLLEGSNLGADRAGNTVMTATRENAITVTANGEGIDGQIAGFTISVSDSEGNVKKSVNASLDDWTETIRAENESKNDNSIVLQTGTKANQSIKVALTDMRSEALGLKGDDGQTLNIGTQKKANAAINVLENAIQKALNEQTKIGSIQSRLEYTAANLTTATENVQASESAIRDADMAKEMTEYTKNNVLLQTSQSMLAQANQSSSNVLGLLA